MQVPSIVSLFTSFQAGLRLIDGGELLQMANLLFGVETGIVATAGGGQARARPLTRANNQILTVATNGDSVMLPQAIPGLTIFIDNIGAANLQVYGQPTNPVTGVGDTIAAAASAAQAATGTGVAQNTPTPAWYKCTVAGQWKQVLGLT